MPPYYRRPPWRTWKRRRSYWRRRRPSQYWRPRKTIRRRYRFYRGRRWVRRKFPYKLKKKLKYLIVKEYQPKKIRKCKIKGLICLFQCGPNRLHREWTNFINSYYPEFDEGGGGWSQLKFSLEALYEQHELLRNHWTQSNVLMPLCRYTGCKIKLFRTLDVDYICHYSICFPMLDTVYQHTNAQPNNMLFYPKHIIVPSLKTKPKGRLYIKKRIRPPEQMTNKWYFQVDLYKTPLLLLTTTACDLNRAYLNPKSVSNNITFCTLNTDFFQNHNFIQTGLGTTYWGPKPGHYLYGTTNGDENPTLGELIFLGQTVHYTAGNPINNTDWEAYSSTQGKRENFGNIFETHYIHQERGVFIGTSPPSEVFKNKNERQSKINNASIQEKYHITKLTQPLFTTVRYTPERDDGSGNKIYLVRTSDLTTGWPEPQDEDLLYEGYPLWCLFWGWTDWQIKYKKISKVEQDFLLVLKTKYTYPQHTIMVPIDKYFLSGHSTWLNEDRTPIDAENWHPTLHFQQLTIENICQTGPLVAKTSSQSIEAHMQYCFYFKWGGCPNDLENIIDPGKQKHYPVPNNILQGPEIQDPSSDYRHEIWPFDIRHQTLTKRGAKRIKQDFTTEIFSSTDSALQSGTAFETTKKAPTLLQTSSEEETEETQEQEQQLQYLRRKQHKLKRQLRQLISQTQNIKY
nr:MAG: ORF1 [TTV-like mini virus]